MNKKKVFEVLELSSKKNIINRLVAFFIISIVLINVVVVIMQTVSDVAVKYADFFRIFEIIVIYVFTIEYLLKLWSCTSMKQFSHPIKGRIRFMLSPFSVIDILSFLPFYIPFVIPLNISVIRIFRIFRLIRIFRLARYFGSLKAMGDVISSKKKELTITAVNILVLLVISSSLIYVVENPAQNNDFSSIPAAMWWGVSTLTTVGYGDVYPITPLGKFLGAIIALLGVGIFALPIGIIAAGFNEKIHAESNIKHEKNINSLKNHMTQHLDAHKKHLTRHLNKHLKCPHCGKRLNR